MVTTVQALENVRPAPIKQRLKELFLIAIEFEEFTQIEVFKKLNLITFNRNIYLLINNLHWNEHSTEKYLA